MEKNLGFIGAGKMAQAIMNGISNSKIVDNFSFSEKNIEIGNQIAEKFNANFIKSNAQLVKESDIIVLCTKPFVVESVLKEISPFIDSNKLIISIAAGITSKFIQNTLNKKVKVIRVMPNTPALVNEGISAICKGEYADDFDFEFAKNLLSSVGKVIEATEDKIDAITALSGSGPANYYYIIDQLAQAGVSLGLDYDTALVLSAQTALGSSKMIFDSNENIQKLIKNVSTPGGCTEVGNNILLNSNISDILKETILKTAKKASELGNS